MKYVIFWREIQQRINLFNKEICDSEESVAVTIQNLQINPQTMRKHRKELEIKVVPYFEAGQAVLNLKTFQTRIVRHADHLDGSLEVYNTDNPHEVELQKNGYVPIIPETWNIIDCMPVDLKKAMEEHYFQFGTEMGKHPRYTEIQASEFETWCE